MWKHFLENLCLNKTPNLHKQCINDSCGKLGSMLLEALLSNMIHQGGKTMKPGLYLTQYSTQYSTDLVVHTHVTVTSLSKLHLETAVKLKIKQTNKRTHDSTISIIIEYEILLLSIIMTY